MAEDASLETLPRQILAKVLSPLDSHDLENVVLALRDPQIAEEASWEALREFASRCDSPASVLASFHEMAGEPLKLCVDAVRRITEEFDTANDGREGKGDRAYFIPLAQTIPDIDEPIESSDYELASFIGRDFTAYFDNASLREVREFNHKDMRKWNDMHAQGSFWTKAPGKRDIACWLLFGTPCDHLTRMFAPDSENADREDAFRDLFAKAMRGCVRVAASAYRDLLKETHRKVRALAVPRVVVVARRLASYGFFEEASALLHVALFDDDRVLYSGALANELYIFVVELRCEAMYAGTFVEPFMGEEDFRTFANTVQLARLVVDRTTRDMETEDVVDRTTREFEDDLMRANQGTMETINEALSPPRRISLRDSKLRYLEKKRRAAETRWTESTGRVPEKLELSYAHSLDRLAAAQHAYGRILGLAHQQKYMQDDYGAYPQMTAELIETPTFIWPNHGAHLFEGRELYVHARCAARGSGFIHSLLEDKRSTAVSTAATAEVLYCAASVKISDALATNAGIFADPEFTHACFREASELSAFSVQCFRNGLTFLDDSQKDLAELTLSQERGERGGKRECANPTCVAREDALAPGRKMLRCSRCTSAFYCSTDCQRTHWRDGHKKTCVAPVSATSAFGDDPAFDPAATMRVLRLEMGDAIAARGAPLLDASLFVVAKDLGKTLRFVDAHGLADPFGDDPDRCEFGPGHGNAHLDGPWVPWELMDETGEPRAGVHVPPWDCAYEGDQWLLLAYACAAEAHGPFHARAASVERMFATQQPRVTPEEVRVRARAVARGYRADCKRRHAGSLGAE